MNAKDLKAHRQRLKEKGICTVCHKRKADQSASICKFCHNRRIELRRKNAQEGVRCKYCTRPIHKHKMCIVCYEGGLETRRKQRVKWVAEGRCGKCGRPNDDPSRSECVICMENGVKRRRDGRSWV